MKKTARKSLKRQEVQRQLPLAEYVRGRLHDFVIDTGLAALAALLEEERSEVCGARYARQSDRRAWRHGSAPGELVLGGRRVSVQRPRARTLAGGEVELPLWSAFSAKDPLDARTVEQMVIGVSTRNYERSIEPVPEGVKARGASKSAASRRFVAATRDRMHEYLSRPLDGLDIVALLIDGVHLADHAILVALGVDAEGRKHVLGVHEGATENTTSCKQLLSGLVERGLSTERTMLVVIDGAKALRRAALDVLGKRVLIQRCQVHKRRNVEELVSHAMRPAVRAMNEAYATRNAPRAKKLLENLARRLESEHPGAAGSLREGLDETLTVMQLGLSEQLERFFSTTNAIENVFSTCERVTRRVKNWRSGEMILRWVVTGLQEAERGFRRVKGYRDMPRLVAVLRSRSAVRGASLAQEHVSA